MWKKTFTDYMQSYQFINQPTTDFDDLWLYYDSKLLVMSLLCSERQLDTNKYSWQWTASEAGLCRSVNRDKGFGLGTPVSKDIE